MAEEFEVKTPFEDIEQLYILSVFDVLKIKPDEGDRKNIKKAVNRAKQKARKSSWEINGIKITEAMITEFERVLDCPMHRLVNEVAIHRQHEIDPEGDWTEEFEKVNVTIDDCKVTSVEVRIKDIISPIPHITHADPEKRIAEFADIKESKDSRDLKDDIFFDI